MYQTLSRFLLCILAVFVIVSPGAVVAESGKKLEDTIPLPTKDSNVDLNNLKRAKLTEEQAVNQLKYMMVKGFARMEEEMIETGSFPAFGLTLSPQGEFKPVVPDLGGNYIPTAVVLTKLAQQMEAIAQTRSMWAVGLMYIRKIKRDDGSYATRLIVMTEHIAGWARSWAYPYKVVDGEVKMGQPTETPVDPIYYVKK